MTLPLLDLIERVHINEAHIQLQDRLPAEIKRAGWELFRVGWRYHAIQFDHHIVTEEHLTLDDCLTEIYEFCYLLELIPVASLLLYESSFPAAPMLPYRFKSHIAKLEKHRSK